MHKKKIGLLSVIIGCFLISSVTFAETRDSSGWNVGNSTNTAYVNVGVTFVYATNRNDAIITYSARVLGEDAYAVIESHPARITIKGNHDGSIDKYIWYNHSVSGTKTVTRQNSYVTVYVVIDNGSDSRKIYLN